MANTQHDVPIWLVIPAAGFGSRFASTIPKQYHKINNQFVLSLTLQRMLASYPFVGVVVVHSANDPYINQIQTTYSQVNYVVGGAERVDSVLSGLQFVLQQSPNSWVLVHDAARPCVSSSDVNNLINHCLKSQQGAILAVPAKDTIKQSSDGQTISQTLTRSQIWQALTPQMFKTEQLVNAIIAGQQQGLNITDEASAVEPIAPVGLVKGQASNIKITLPEDLAIAEFILSTQLENGANHV